MLDYHYFIAPKSEDGVAWAEGDSYRTFEEAKAVWEKLPNKENYNIIRCGF